MEIGTRTRPRSSAEDRKHARGLFGRRNRVGARPRRFAPDVDEVGALGFHPHGVLDRGERVDAGRRLREGVGRDVEDAHDQRARTEVQDAAVGKRDGVETASGEGHSNSELGIRN